MQVRLAQIFLMFLLLLGVVLLSGCSGTKETLGLERQSPDEFAVVRRAPLSLPPEYNLRPPVPGAPRPQEQAASAQAKAAVLGVKSATGGTVSAGESALLQRVGTGEIDPEIRAKVDAETATRVDKSKPVVKKLLSIGSDEVPAVIVDPAAEVERLREGRGDDETPSIGN